MDAQTHHNNAIWLEYNGLNHRRITSSQPSVQNNIYIYNVFCKIKKKRLPYIIYLMISAKLTFVKNQGRGLTHGHDSERL